MKVIHNFLAALLIVISAATTNVTMAGGLETKVKKVKLFNRGKQVKLIYLSKSAVEVNIRIIDKQGHTVYRGIAQAEGGFLLPFDMSRLPVGEYTFEIVDGDEIIVETVTTESTMTSKNTLSMIQGSNAKNFAVTSTSALPAKLDLVIYDANGEVVYEDILDSNKKVGSRYNLEDLETDDFHVVIWEGNEMLKDLALKF